MANPHEPMFVGREMELDELSARLDTPRPLINIYGEPGIGKTRLLKEAARRLKADHEAALVLTVDLEQIVSHPSAERPRAVLEALISQSKGVLSGQWEDVDQVAQRIVDQLNALAAERPVAIFFDTTEFLHHDRAFWTWIEMKIVGPLLIERRVSLVFAGRVPVPWRRVEVRRALKLLPLQQLEEGHARRFVLHLLEDAAWFAEASEGEREQAADLILLISCQHPGLIHVLADEVRSRPWPPDDLGQVKQRLSAEIVKPFIYDELFKSIPEEEQEWKDILWWLSILDWFDVTIVMHYIKAVAPALAQDQPEYYFIKGLSRLRVQYTIVFQVEPGGGNRLHGTIRDIVRTCLIITSPEDCRMARLKAADTFEALAQFLEGDKETQDIFRKEASEYRESAEECVS
ncbi:MAG: ATP-binding protein [Anaerolineae bacterium]|nr:ATP-binding protein [Anaerolineae bacterium]